MTDQQLIKKLRRGWRFMEGQDISNRDLERAADRIEELVKERDDLGRKLNTARYGQPDFAWSIHEEELADLRVKLTKAVEERDEWKNEAAMWLEAYTSVANKTRAVLAELEVEPLGAEFEAVWDANKGELYEP